MFTQGGYTADFPSVLANGKSAAYCSTRKVDDILTTLVHIMQNISIHKLILKSTDQQQNPRDQIKHFTKFKILKKHKKLYFPPTWSITDLCTHDMYVDIWLLQPVTGYSDRMWEKVIVGGHLYTDWQQKICYKILTKISMIWCGFSGGFLCRLWVAFSVELSTANSPRVIIPSCLELPGAKCT